MTTATTFAQGQFEDAADGTDVPRFQIKVAKGSDDGCFFGEGVDFYDNDEYDDDDDNDGELDEDVVDKFSAASKLLSKDHDASATVSVSHRVATSIQKMQAMEEQAKRTLTCGRDDRATSEQVLDPRTRLVLFKLLNTGLFDTLQGCVSTGKEANVYYATAGRKVPNNHKKTTTELQNILLAHDPRAKYLSKLSQKGIVGGLDSVNRAREQVASALQKGDAAAGHWEARNLVRQSTEVHGGGGRTTDGTSHQIRWMARTGTGHLLQYMTQRAMKIVLLPSSGAKGDTTDAARTAEGQDMKEFDRQLKEVVIDRFVTPHEAVQTETGERRLASDLIQDVLAGLELVTSPERCMMVSDQEDYLRAAKDAGMVTCRIRPHNAPRGNVSVHYMIPTLSELRQVIDSINGVSFNAALKGR